MPELNPLSNEQIFLKKIAENTGSNYNTGDVSEINPLTIDQILLKEIAANTAGQTGDITELEEKVTAIQDMISDAYSASATYAVGDYCIYNDTLYKCNTAIATGEAFTPAKWDATTAAEEIKSNTQIISSNITNTEKKITGVINNVNLFYVDGTKTYTCINFGNMGITRAAHYLISHCGQSGISLMIPIAFIGNGGFGNIEGISIPPEASNAMGWLTSGNTLKIPNSNNGNWGTVSVVNLIPAENVSYNVTYEN